MPAKLIKKVAKFEKGTDKPAPLYGRTMTMDPENAKVPTKRQRGEVLAIAKVVLDKLFKTARMVTSKDVEEALAAAFKQPLQRGQVSSIKFRLGFISIKDIYQNKWFWTTEEVWEELKRQNQT